MSKYLAQALKSVSRHHPEKTNFQKLLIVADNCDDLRKEALSFLPLAPR